MKTVFLKELNGHKIIVGFGNAAIDPEETKKKVNLLLPDTQIGGNIKIKVEEIKAIVISAEDEKEKSRQCFMSNDQAGAATHHQNFLDLEPVHKLKEQELGLLLPDLEKKRLEFYEGEAIYFEPKKGEVIVSTEYFDQIEVELNSLAQNECLKFIQSPTGVITTEKIPDFVGSIYFILEGSVWEKCQITLVGKSIPVGGVPEADLTPAQIDEIEIQLEALRVSKLSMDEKAAEKTVALEKAAIESERLFNQYTIQNTADPLGEAQAWLASEIVLIKEKYA